MIPTLLTHPFVSIIVPTHNRCSLLPRTLAALVAQTYPADRMELLLVADGCTDDTAVFASHYSTSWKLHILEQPGLGPAAARNYGAAQAKGEVLIFLDDDMEVVPGFVAAHVQIQQTHPQIVAVGALHPAHRQPGSYFERSLWDWWEGKFFRMRQPGYRFHYDDLFGGNFSVRADFLAQVGGFDPELRCHEDYELGVRLLAAGATCKLVMAAAAVHHDITDAVRATQRRTAEGHADMQLAHRHVDLHVLTPLAQGAYTLFGRTLRYLAFRRPSLGDRIALACQFPLRWLEFFWLFSYWQALFYHLQDYWYWRGVGAVADPAMIQGMFATEVRPLPPITIIDLAPGVAAAEQHLDANRPTSARLFVGRQWVGDIPEVPGAERLHGGHLRRILATELADPLATALALAAFTPQPIDEVADEAWRQAGQLPTKPEKPFDWNVYLLGPKKVVEIELANGVPDVEVTDYSGLHALIRSQGRPLGCITLTDLAQSTVTAVTLHQTIAQQLGWQAVSLAWGQSPSAPTAWPPISVIVCTRNRTAQLAECLQALLGLDYPHVEILVVDNAPDDEQTARLTASLSVRYVREERPGLDWARNRGLHEARHSIVAFTDDDARPDRGWLRAIAQTFTDPEVTAVTGSVLPAKLETPAQNLFEFGYGGMNHGFKRRLVRRASCSSREILWASAFGVGANMAFRKSALAELGGFDVALDVGTPSGGCGDVEMFHRLVTKGYALVYEPAALVWHQHRPEMADLEQLMRNNGRSFGCYLLTCARNRTVSRSTVLYFGLRFWLWNWIGKRLLDRNAGGFPRRLVWRELWAALGSPVFYLRSQAHARRSAHLSKAATAEHVVSARVTK